MKERSRRDVLGGDVEAEEHRAESLVRTGQLDNDGAKDPEMHLALGHNGKECLGGSLEKEAGREHTPKGRQRTRPQIPPEEKREKG